MRKCDILPLIFTALMACTPTGRGLRGGDLVFVPSGDSGFEKAISGATGSVYADFSHVGIIDIAGGDTLVIEAIPRKGVTVTPLAEIKAAERELVYIAVDDPAAAGAPAEARKYIGQPYDWEFLAGNGAVYCSELVQLSYLHPDGTPLFAPVPISFLDSTGHIPQFWLDLYSSRGMQVPHAAPGSSPNSIFRQCHIYKKISEKRP